MSLIPYVLLGLRIIRWVVAGLTGLSLVAICLGLLIGLLLGAMVTGCNATLEAVNGRALIKKTR